MKKEAKVEYGIMQSQSLGAKRCMTTMRWLLMQSASY
jgi:hypothetical protein